MTQTETVVWEKDSVKVVLGGRTGPIEVNGNRMYPTEAWELIGTIEEAISAYTRELEEA